MYSVTVLPMANKDGVARGRTRFNLRGKDLNRNWDKPADPELAPENAALSAGSKARSPPAAGRISRWSCTTTATAGCTSAARRCRSSIVISRAWRSSKSCCAARPGSPRGRTNAAFRNSGTLGDGWLERYGIDAAVHEFNCNWIAGLKDYTSSRHWMDYGASLAEVFHDYFERVKP